MNKLSKEKKDRLVLIAVGSAMVLLVLYVMVLGTEQNKLTEEVVQLAGTKDKLGKAERLNRTADIIEGNLAESQKALEQRQKDMAPPGQYYYWFLKLLDQFRKDEGLETNFIVDISQPEFSEAGLLPRFQYKAAVFTVRATGYYKEIGKFFADFENAFPYMRLQNIRLVPESSSRFANGVISGGEGSAERLAVEFKVVTLIKPATT